MEYRPAADCCSGGQTLDASDRLAPPGEFAAGRHDADLALIRRAQAGDREAFAGLYLRHHDAVAEVCRKRLRDPHLTEDATQETFLRAWKALPGFTHDVDLSHWLRRIASNHCTDLWRAGQRGGSIASITAPPLDVEDPAAEDAVAVTADRLAVHALLDSLRPRDAELLVEHHAMDTPVRVLAQRWQMTKGAMEVALHRARQRARRGAEERGLRGLVPLDALRRTASWTQRSITDIGGVSSPAAALLCNIAVVVMAVAVPQLVAPDGSGPAKAREPAVRLADAMVEARKISSSQALPRARSNTDGSKRRVTTTNGSASGPRRQRQTALVEWDPVPVPVAGGHIRSSAGEDWVRVRRYGVRNPTTGGNLVANADYDKGEPDPSHDVGAAVCPVAASGEPVTYCD